MPSIPPLVVAISTKSTNLVTLECQLSTDRPYTGEVVQRFVASGTEKLGKIGRNWDEWAVVRPTCGLLGCRPLGRLFSLLALAVLSPFQNVILLNAKICIIP